MLLARFLPPKPTCAVGSQEDNQEVLEAVVAFVNGASSAAGVAAGVVSAGGQALQPTVATNNPGLQGTNVLHDIDHAAQVISVPKA